MSDTSAEQNKAIASDFFAHLNNGEIDGALDLMTDEATWFISGKPETFPSAGSYDKDRVSRLLHSMFKRFKDGFKMTVTGAIAEGNKAAVEAESYAELVNGRVYNQHYHILLEFQGGKISAIREYIDTQHAYAVWIQPEPAVEKA
ncbi:MAG TPA: nuclear transport factor 2 family protein [Phototrophicaceae bacterium]|jgi:ketosteroid isomerase-like protein|nr:nuclear transport factor 2 family protein [Phototrophicaceae bacterium]